MDPRLFHIDWEQLAEVLVAVIVLAFIVERALSLVFENRFFVERFDVLNIKELLAFALSFWICYHWNFDLISVLLGAENTSTVGAAVTAAVVAGGSKASIKLFHDILKVKSDSAKERDGEQKLVIKEEASATTTAKVVTS